MLRKRHSLPQNFVSSSSSKPSIAMKTATSYDTFSGTMSRGVQQPLMTRDNTITCTSTTSSETRSRTTSCCRRQPLVDPLTHPNDGLAGSGNNIYGPIEDDNETNMTSSALIAHTFRIFQYQEYLEMLHQCPVNGLAPNVEPLRATCFSTIRTDIYETSGGLQREQRKNLGQFHDMLCSVSPVIVKHTMPIETGHEVLSHYRKIPHTIVVDSHRPDVAPHIVITPPPDPWDAFFMAESNRIGCQTPWNLTVPPLFMSTCRMPTYQEWMLMFYPPPPPEFHATSSTLVSIPGLQCVFNRASFQILVNRAQNERLYYSTREHDLVNHRCLCKVAAIAASQRAQDFRIRYTDTGIFESLEKPFQWADPADPILSAFGKCRDTHVIHSVNPFLVPHIVIQECALNDPWTFWNNATDCQDLAFGNSLGVISSNGVPLTYINVPDQDTDETINMTWDDEDYLSSTDSSCPETPSRLDELGKDFFFEEDINECPSYLKCSASASVVRQEIPPPRSKAAFFILDEDEDDGPPEFDNWYLSIAKRTQEAEEAEESQ